MWQGAFSGPKNSKEHPCAVICLNHLFAQLQLLNFIILWLISSVLNKPVAVADFLLHEMSMKPGMERERKKGKKKERGRKREKVREKGKCPKFHQF